MTSKHIRLVSGFLSLLMLAGCGGGSYAPRGVKVGKPYTVSGVTYRPDIDINYDKVGIASWYGPGFHGKKTATGETYDQHDMTAAHPTLPMPSMVRVTNLSNGRTAVVRINDRGPFKRGRIIDLSKAAAQSLGINGLAQVRVQYLPQETAEYIASLGIPVPAEMQYAGNMPPPPPPIAAEDMAEEQNSLVVSSGGRMEEETVRVAPLQQITESDLIAPAAAAAEPVYERVSTAQREYIVRSETTDNKSGLLRYFIQAGAFSLRENAKRVAQQLADIGRPDIQEVQTPERTIYRVRIGPLATSEEAENALERVRSNGITDAKIVLN